MEPIKEPLDVIPESKAARWAWRVSLIPLLGVPLFIVLAFLALYRIGSKGRTGFWLLRRGVIAIFLINVVSYFGLYLSGYSGYFPIIYKAYRFLPHHGVYQTFYDNETAYTQQHWRFGQQEGLETTWDALDRKIEEGRYVNGLKEGFWTTWNYKQLSQVSGEYKKGKREGIWTTRRWTGEREEREYRDDKMNGKRTLYNGLGDKTWEIEYKNNMQAGVYKNGQREGDWTEWNNTDQKKSHGKYENGKHIGLWQYWDESGKLKKEEVYDNSSKLVKTIEYKNGKPIEDKQ
jgi:antitoxin component YwqK of YwqJK toxin-antitoxin module